MPYRPALAALLVVLAALPAPAADPPPTIDQLVERLEQQRRQQAEVAKLVAETAGQLRDALDKLNKKLADLGITPGPAPTPPGPDPAPPADPLAAAVRAAYAADAGPRKADQLKDLAELYRQAADLAGDGTVLTTGQLMDRIRAAAAALKIDGLTGCRRLIAGECAAALGTDPDAALTGDLRGKARALFLRVHVALKGANQ